MTECKSRQNNSGYAVNERNDVDENDGQEITADKVTDKFSDNAGDNSLTRFEINRSITATETANEHSFAKALMKGLDDISKGKDK
jgi:hypothetical protein